MGPTKGERALHKWSRAGDVIWDGNFHFTIYLYNLAYHSVERALYMYQLWLTFCTIALVFLLVFVVGALIKDMGISKGVGLNEEVQQKAKNHCVIVKQNAVIKVVLDTIVCVDADGSLHHYPGAIVARRLVKRKNADGDREILSFFFCRLRMRVGHCILGTEFHQNHLHVGNCCL